MSYPLFNIAPEMDTVVYAVKPGDTLSGIVRHYYGPLPPTQHQELIRSIQAANPKINNPDRIWPGQLIKLDVPVPHCRIPTHQLPIAIPSPRNDEWFHSMERNWVTSTPEERGLQMGLAKAMLGIGSANLAMIDRTFKNAIPMTTELAENYEKYKSGGLSKGQYDYQRRKTLQRLKTHLGPTNLLLNGANSPNEVLRISRRAGTEPTQAITQQISKMQRLSKVAARGGVALSVVGLGIACHEMAQTDDIGKKNDIFVETFGAFAGSAAFGLAATIGVALMATPVGWAGALIIGAGSVITGFATSHIARGVYDATGRPVDFANLTGVASLCSRPPDQTTKYTGPRISDATLSVL